MTMLLNFSLVLSNFLAVDLWLILYSGSITLFRTLLKNCIRYSSFPLLRSPLYTTLFSNLNKSKKNLSTFMYYWVSSELPDSYTDTNMFSLPIIKHTLSRLSIKCGINFSLLWRLTAKYTFYKLWLYIGTESSCICLQIWDSAYSSIKSYSEFTYSSSLRAL